MKAAIAGERFVITHLYRYRLSKFGLNNGFPSTMLESITGRLSQ
ncbi:hypothetical protein [Paenibacillus foliorum]|nr:hypothetical protein [Paenibacillus foliorum]